MAAGSDGGGALRLRLLFDYPPPGSPGCALCWLLLEPAQVRLVTDLLSLIRQRFGFSRRARLSLFLEGALLPPAESARLVRDNDSLRVKLDAVESDEERGRRRRREGSEEREAAASDGETPGKRRRRTRKEQRGAQEGPAAGEEGSAAGRSRGAKRAAPRRPQGTRAPAEARERGGKSGPKGSARSGAPGAAPSEPSSTSSGSDSSQGNAGRNKPSRKPAAAAALPRNASPAAADSNVKTGVSGKVTVKSKAAQSKTAVSKKRNQAQSSSSDSDSSAEEGKATTAQNSATQKKLLPNNTAPVKTSTPKAPSPQTSSSESDSSDSETLVTKKPKANAGLSNSLVRNGDKQSPGGVAGALPSPVLGRGRGTGDGNFWTGSRGRGFQGATRGRGRGENQGFFYNYDSEGQKQRQINEPVTNTSILVQNPVEVPKRNYSVLPLLAAPPQVGERIAFKRLELNDNYSPEVSDYKEGKIISWNADKKQIELEILSSPAVAKEPGKFDLVYQSADGAELIEYAIPQDTKITESWDALIEPRLIVEPSVNGSSLENGKI